MARIRFGHAAVDVTLHLATFALLTGCNTSGNVDEVNPTGALCIPPNCPGFAADSGAPEVSAPGPIDATSPPPPAEAGTLSPDGGQVCGTRSGIPIGAMCDRNVNTGAGCVATHSDPLGFNSTAVLNSTTQLPVYEVPPFGPLGALQYGLTGPGSEDVFAGVITYSEYANLRALDQTNFQTTNSQGGQVSDIGVQGASFAYPIYVHGSLASQATLDVNGYLFTGSQAGGFTPVDPSAKFAIWYDGTSLNVGDGSRIQIYSLLSQPPTNLSAGDSLYRLTAVNPLLPTGQNSMAPNYIVNYVNNRVSTVTYGGITFLSFSYDSNGAISGFITGRTNSQSGYRVTTAIVCSAPQITGIQGAWGPNATNTMNVTWVTTPNQTLLIGGEIDTLGYGERETRDPLGGLMGGTTATDAWLLNFKTAGGKVTGAVFQTDEDDTDYNYSAAVNPGTPGQIRGMVSEYGKVARGVKLDQLGRVIESVTKGPNDVTSRDVQYTYDGSNNITKVAISENGPVMNPATVATYTYTNAQLGIVATSTAGDTQIQYHYEQVGPSSNGQVPRYRPQPSDTFGIALDGTTFQENVPETITYGIQDPASPTEIVTGMSVNGKVVATYAVNGNSTVTITPSLAGNTVKTDTYADSTMQQLNQETVTSPDGTSLSATGFSYVGNVPQSVSIADHGMAIETVTNTIGSNTIDPGGNPYIITETAVTTVGPTSGGSTTIGYPAQNNLAVMTEMDSVTDVDPDLNTNSTTTSNMSPNSPNTTVVETGFYDTSSDSDGENIKIPVLRAPTGMNDDPSALCLGLGGTVEGLDGTQVVCP